MTPVVSNRPADGQILS